MSEWREQAACVGADPEMFFPFKNESHIAEAAKELCRICPVREECLDWALELNMTDGVWGGLSGHERIRLRERVA